MHPFCCVSAISDHSSSLKPHFTDFPMPSPPLPPAGAVRSDPVTRPADHNHTNHCISHNNNNSISEVMINDLVGNGISGILYKWVNYGKGWRPRWFVLQDGVLSYYKIHGPDKIVVNLEIAKGSKVIGEESMRRISRNRNSHNQFQFHRRKPFGEIHLKVPQINSSIFYFNYLFYR